jgi:hypothetical protein
LPPHSHPFGLSYAEWSAKWWQWASGIPAAQNPLFDTTGEFADQEQSGHVWFLAGAFGGTVERTATVPVGKALFFPILNALWWAPDDLGTAAFVAETYLGLSPAEVANLTDEELIGLLSNFNIDPYHVDPPYAADPSLLELSLTIDGVPVRNLSAYKKTSPAFHIADTEFIKDLITLGFSGPIDELNNQAVSAGYWIMLAPLRPGRHEIHFTSKVTNPFSPGGFALDVTYHLIVAPKRK